MSIFFSIALMGCNDQTIRARNDNPNGDLNGAIAGRVCDPSGRTWLPDARAYTHLIKDNVLYDTRTAFSDRDGYFLLDDLPEGEYEFWVQHGNEVLITDEVWVGRGETYELDEPDCFDPLELRVAVITGDYDDFQLVLQTMGFANYDLIDGLTTAAPLNCEECTDHLVNFLTDLEWMQQFDIIMFNGGFVEDNVIYESDPKKPTGTPSVVNANIKAFVEAGGSVYASDWAYDVVETNWPDRIDFLGDDLEPDAAQAGELQIVNAAISDAALADWLGLEQDFVDIEYDLPVWPPMEGTSESVSTHLSGSVDVRIGNYSDTLPQVPLLASFNDGEGKVVYATFRVAKNATTDMMLILQYMMYSL